jgi:hypothetical protein
MINPKRHLCTVAVFLCFCSAGLAQQQLPPNRLSNFLDKHLPDSYVSLAGEGTFTTYGAGISFPVYWVEERVKIIPLFGFMWQNFTAEGFNSRSAAGAKFLYYFQKQPFGFAPMNSFYAGLGGMGTINNFFGSTTVDYSRAGAILGYNFIINQTVQLAPELFLGANETGNFRAEIGFVFHFGR